jgi:hypothetical protein
MARSTDGSGSSYRTPRWVKISGIVAALVVVVLLVAMLSGGQHGPWQHAAPAHQAVDPGQ